MKRQPLVPRRLLCCVAMISMAAASTAKASESHPVDVHAGVDLYSRYIWRGTDIGDSPSIQPALSVACRGFRLGAWGAYSTSRESAEHNEIDFWLDYTARRENGAALALIVTDYTFPNAGIAYSSSDAHTLETGMSITGPQGFPLTVAGYVNVSNDDGNNTYFQADYPASAGDVALRFFVGLAGGSRENPDYYGTDSANVINMGIFVSRAVEVTDRFSPPLTGLLIYNPRAEVPYLVVAVSF